MFFVYEVLLYLVSLLALPFFLLLGLFRGKYVANFPERMGRYRTPARPHELWIHAVSVGETLAAKSVVDAIVRERPHTSIVFTTTTITGQAQARRLFPFATVTYFPFDFAFAVRRFLEHHQPGVFATMETEIWPNVTRLAAARGVRLALVNGRISDRSYPRYRLLRMWLGPIFQKYERILARETTDHQRFIALGARASSVEIAGNVKFDFEPPSTTLDIAPQLEAMIAGRHVVVLGSTVEGEDEALLPELQRFISDENVFVILAPRKGERFDVVAELLATTTLRVVRRSALGTNAPACDVLLLDSFGDLARLYPFATVAFVGGSLVQSGGHNPIEPAAAGVPVCFGPSMSNFREIASLFLQHEAAAEVTDARALFAFAASMLHDDARRATWGDRGRALVRQNRGASAYTAHALIELLGESREERSS